MRDKPLHPDERNRQRRALSLWLSEWELDLALRDDHRRGPPAPVRAFGQPDPQPGDIRLLPPAPVSMPALERPVYVAVLRPAGDDAFELAPFSRFSLPATPREWATGLKAAPLRVLCLWGLTRRPSRALAGTWRIRAMPADKLNQALRLARIAPSERLPRGIPASRVGPRLVHPLDPRFRYLAEERLLFDELLQGLDPIGAGAPRYAIPETDLLRQRAAESRVDPF